MPRYIDADALIADIKATIDGSGCVNHEGEILDCIEYAATADVVPVVRGEWRQGKEFPTYPRVPFISTAYYCSNCEGEAYWDAEYGQQLFGFCHKCGAKMEVKE